jgi:hypothetical protein
VGRDPELWQQLLAVEHTTRDFSDLDAKTRMYLNEFNPNADGVDNLALFGALRLLLQDELSVYYFS